MYARKAAKSKELPRQLASKANKTDVANKARKLKLVNSKQPTSNQPRHNAQR